MNRFLKSNVTFVRSALMLVPLLLLTTSFNPPKPYGIKTIVIDAGHGGKDPGCHGVKFYEKDIALNVSLKLGKLIEENLKDVKVIYTRKTDVFLELNERASIANDAKADLFICVHVNSACFRDKKLKKDICNVDVVGSGTYVMGLSKSKGNLDIAKRENESVLLEDDYQKKYDGFDPNSDEANIIFSMYQNAYLEQSLNLAAKIQHQYKNYAGRVDRGVHQANFLVLWKTTMPSLLTEMGFLTNPTEEKFLGSDKGQDYIATSVFRAIRSYKNEVEGKPDVLNDDEKIMPYSPELEVKEKEDSGSGRAFEDQNNINKKPDENPDKPKSGSRSSDEIFFRVQVASSNKKIPLTSEKFKGLPEVWEYKAGNYYKYTAGKAESLAEAASIQTRVREKGYKDAFIVAFKNDERVDVNEAVKLLKK